MPDFRNGEQSVMRRLFLTFNSFVLLVLLLIPIVILYTIYKALLGYTPKTLHESILHVYHPFLLYSIVAVFEEFSFRGFLTRFNPLLCAFSVSAILATYFKKVVYRNMTFLPEGLAEAGILLALLLPIVYLLLKFNDQRLSLLWEKHSRTLVYASAFLFAFLHFFNSADLSISYLPSTVFQLIMAFVFSFVRIRAGLIYAIIIHFTWNWLIYGV